MRTIIVIASLLLTGCSHMANDAWSGQDKAQHFLASAMLSAAGNEYAQHQGLQPGPQRRYRPDVFRQPWRLKRALGQPPGWERLELEGLRLGCCRRIYRLCGLATGTLLEAQTFPFPMQH